MIKVFIAEVITDNLQRELTDQRMAELEQLVWTYGGLTIVRAVQQRIKPYYKTYIGPGKLEEIIHDMKQEGASVLIFGNILKPGQIYNVNEILREACKDDEIQMQARDRVDLILKIFDRHAKSTEARLQIELASIKHMGPRIFGMGMELSRQGGGIGTSGIGETNTEIMRRHLSNRKRQIGKKLAQYEQVRATHRQARQKKYLPTIGLVGYTNAGKSSLMNSLTGKGVLVEDKLFATLGTDVGKVYIQPTPATSGGEGDREDGPQTPTPEGTTGQDFGYTGGYHRGVEVLINDTIGFIRDLPPGLIQAFRSTLEDSIEADVLLHVIDTGDELWDDKVRVVDEILDSIGAEQKRVYVLNKVDVIEDKTKILESHRVWLESYCEECQYDEPTILAVSAHTGEGMEELKQRMVEWVRR